MYLESDLVTRLIQCFDNGWLTGHQFTAFAANGVFAGVARIQPIIVAVFIMNCGLQIKLK